MLVLLMAGERNGASTKAVRDQQLRDWRSSETNKPEYSDKRRKNVVTFSDGCVFLASASAGDVEELQRLLDKGADINTVNQDGITALHAACIDNNLTIVEFLVESGADVNRSDVEGWTPLHATASCGSLTVAKFLINHGSDLSLVNNDGDLPLDLVQEEGAMSALLRREMAERGVDGKAARNREERCMLDDVTQWLRDGRVEDVPHPKTGATALHVAAGKGYIRVIRLLLEAGVDVNSTDYDGWTPLHAAVHWGQTEAVELLCDSLADMNAVNAGGHTPTDLAESSLRPLLDELRRKQLAMRHNRKHKTSIGQREPPTKQRKESQTHNRDIENGPKENSTENEDSSENTDNSTSSSSDTSSTSSTSSNTSSSSSTENNNDTTKDQNLVHVYNKDLLHKDGTYKGLLTQSLETEQIWSNMSVQNGNCVVKDISTREISKLYASHSKVISVDESVIFNSKVSNELLCSLNVEDLASSTPLMQSGPSWCLKRPSTLPPPYSSLLKTLPEEDKFTSSSDQRSDSSPCYDATRDREAISGSAEQSAGSSVDTKTRLAGEQSSGSTAVSCLGGNINEALQFIDDGTGDDIKWADDDDDSDDCVSGVLFGIGRSVVVTGTATSPCAPGKVVNSASLDASEVQSWRRPSSLRTAKPPSREALVSPRDLLLAERSLSSPAPHDDVASDISGASKGTAATVTTTTVPLRRTVSFDRENRTSLSIASFRRTASCPSVALGNARPRLKPDISSRVAENLHCGATDGVHQERTAAVSSASIVTTARDLAQEPEKSTEMLDISTKEVKAMSEPRYETTGEEDVALLLKDVGGVVADGAAAFAVVRDGDSDSALIVDRATVPTDLPSVSRENGVLSDCHHNDINTGPGPQSTSVVAVDPRVREEDVSTSVIQSSGSSSARIGVTVQDSSTVSLSTTISVTSSTPSLWSVTPSSAPTSPTSIVSKHPLIFSNIDNVHDDVGSSHFSRRSVAASDVSVSIKNKRNSMSHLLSNDRQRNTDDEKSGLSSSLQSPSLSASSSYVTGRYSTVIPINVSDATKEAELSSGNLDWKMNSLSKDRLKQSVSVGFQDGSRSGTNTSTTSSSFFNPKSSTRQWSSVSNLSHLKADRYDTDHSIYRNHHRMADVPLKEHSSPTNFRSSSSNIAATTTSSIVSSSLRSSHTLLSKNSLSQSHSFLPNYGTLPYRNHSFAGSFSYLGSYSVRSPRSATTCLHKSPVVRVSSTQDSSLSTPQDLSSDLYSPLKSYNSLRNRKFSSSNLPEKQHVLMGPASVTANSRTQSCINLSLNVAARRTQDATASADSSSAGVTHTSHSNCTTPLKRLSASFSSADSDRAFPGNNSSKLGHSVQCGDSFSSKSWSSSQSFLEPHQCTYPNKPATDTHPAATSNTASTINTVTTSNTHNTTTTTISTLDRSSRPMALSLKERIQRNTRDSAVRVSALQDGLLSSTTTTTLTIPSLTSPSRPNINSLTTLLPTSSGNISSSSSSSVNSNGAVTAATTATAAESTAVLNAATVSSTTTTTTTTTSLPYGSNTVTATTSASPAVVSAANVTTTSVSPTRGVTSNVTTIPSSTSATAAAVTDNVAPAPTITATTHTTIPPPPKVAPVIASVTPPPTPPPKQHQLHPPSPTSQRNQRQSSPIPIPLQQKKQQQQEQTATATLSPTYANTEINNSHTNSNNNNTSSTIISTSSSQMSAAFAKMSPGSVIKNFFKSFVPPSRDDESETQRKANARLIRSSRRSTQGVSLDDLKTAETLYKPGTEVTDAKASSTTTTTITTTASPAPSSSSLNNSSSNKRQEEEDRRPSWRLKVDDNDKNRFCLEDVRGKDNAAITSSNHANGVQLRQKSVDDKREPEDSDSQSLAAFTQQSREGSQAAIQRRKKPKRRSTGVVRVEMDDIDPEKKSQKQQEPQPPPPHADDSHSTTVSERPGDDGGSSKSVSRASSAGPDGRGELDYKKLYEEQLAENARLLDRVREYEREKADLLATADVDRREKRALERRLSEMEEDLRMPDQLQQDNKRLKDENEALIRVISKLSR